MRADPVSVKPHLAAGCLVVCLALIPGCTGAEPRPSAQRPTATAAPDIEEVAAALKDRVKDYDGLAAGVIALVRVGDDVEVVIRGQADVEQHVRMSAEQTFPIASITKPMTATVVMQLVEEGRLSLGDDVRKWLPELGSLATPITIEQVLSHRSGLLRDPTERDIERQGSGHTTGLLRVAAQHGLEFAPGTEGLYSNLGFGALGVLVERVLDQPLGTVMEDRIFAKTPMPDSALAGAFEIHGYDGAKDVTRTNDFSYVPAAGSVVSTVADLDAFFSALWEGRLVDPDSVSDMRRSRGTVRVSPNLTQDYGLGLTRDKVTCGATIGHGGRRPGFSIEAWMLEGEDRSTVVMMNESSADFMVAGIVETALCG
jgi:D-alanyl-D-alanine carboxypeptidase